MLHPVYHSVLTNLQSYQQYTRAPPFSAYPCQDLFFVDFLMIVFLTCLRLYLIVVLSLISLMISDFEYLFICLLIILLIYLLCKNIYSDLIPIFSHFFILSFMSYLYILDISLSLFISFANIFSHSGGCLSVLLMVSFAQQVFWGHLLHTRCCSKMCECSSH